MHENRVGDCRIAYFTDDKQNVLDKTALNPETIEFREYEEAQSSKAQYRTMPRLPPPTCPAAFTSPIPFGAACPDLRGNADGDRMLGEFLQRFRHTQPAKWSTVKDPYVAMHGSSGGAMSLQWALWDRVCGTIVKSETAIAGIVHPDRERYISLAEARRCGSFPDAFEFTDRRRAIERIGNSVPPRFMQAVASHVYETLLKPVHFAAAQTRIEDAFGSADPNWS